MEHITIKEVAKLCGVGVSTVSRAINNHPDINPETKQKILDAIREYNYVPNNSARNLKRAYSNTLMASHIAAFRILYGLRIRLSGHIGRLSLGYLNGTSTGAIKKTMEQNVEKIENFVAHTIPDLVNVLATIVLMFIIFYAWDSLFHKVAKH